MMSKTFLGLALCACAMNGASALLEALTFGTAGALTGTAIGGAATSTVFLTTGGAALVGAAVLLKGLAAASVVAPALTRGKRNVEIFEETDFAFATLAETEPAQCYRRLICDLATGAMPKSSNDQIMVLFDGPVAPESPKFDFATAAAVGKQVKSVQLCELRYSCPLTSGQIAKLFN